MQDTDQVPLVFRALWAHAEGLIVRPRDDRTARVIVLPPSLTRAAELVERSAPYRELVEGSLWAEGPSEWRVRDALRRAGFYQAVQEGADIGTVWRLMNDRLSSHSVSIRTLVLLDGCWFPTDRFRIAGASIARPSADDLDRLGPQRETARTFFPNEQLDYDWYTRVWFLITEDVRQVKPSSIHIRFGYDVLSRFWEPLTGLALYRTDYFGLPIVLESDPGWRLERVRWSDPMVNLVDDGQGDVVEVPRSDYDVDEKNQDRFAAFLAFFDDALKSSRRFRSFALAARRYLRGIQIAGPHPLTGDDYDDSLLQYVFALEATLLFSGERDNIGDKLATRAAWLVGTSDRVRNETVAAVKKLYGARSSVVHGGKSKGKSGASRDLDGVRDLLRRTLVG